MINLLLQAVIDGKFIGLPLDDINEDDKTDTRIEATHRYSGRLDDASSRQRFIA